MYRVARSVTGAEADASVPTWPGPYPTITAYIAKQNQMPVRTTEPTRAMGTFRRGRCTSSATVVEDSKPKKANTTKMNASPMPDRPDGELPGFQACGTCPCAPPLTRIRISSAPTTVTSATTKARSSCIDRWIDHNARAPTKAMMKIISTQHGMSTPKFDLIRPLTNEPKRLVFSGLCSAYAKNSSQP